MTRYIYCTLCLEALLDRLEQSTTKGEGVATIAGECRKAMRCDDCNRALYLGDLAFAVTMFREGEYVAGWERDYLSPLKGESRA